MEERTPQKVLDQLMSARGELDVILDLIASVEQQQFVSLAHIPRQREPAAIAQQTTLRLARRRVQLKSTAERLRTGTEAIRSQSTVTDLFLKDLMEIRREWKLSRRSANMGGTFFVDISLALPSSSCSNTAIPWGDLQRPEDTQMNIVPSAEGTACMVVSGQLVSGTEAPVVIKGPAAITTELRKRQLLHSWRLIGRIVGAEAQQATATSEGSDAATIKAVQHMATRAANEAAGAVTGATSTEAQLLLKEETSADINLAASSSGAQGEGVGLAAQDLARYRATASCQFQFESRALRCLASLCQAARTPALIQQTRATEESNNAGLHNPSMLQQLTSWLRHAALCHAVDTSLAQQQERLQQQTAGTQTAIAVAYNAPHLSDSEGARVWAVAVNSRPEGMLLAEQGALRWEGEALPGQVGGSQMGRRQLDTLLDKVISLASSSR